VARVCPGRSDQRFLLNSGPAERLLADEACRNAHARFILLEQEMKWLIAATAVVIAAVCAPASGESLRRIKWSDLVPRMEKYDDPFLDLSSEQKLDLSVVAAVRRIKARGETLEPPQQAKFDEAVVRLSQDSVPLRVGKFGMMWTLEGRARRGAPQIRAGAQAGSSALMAPGR